MPAYIHTPPTFRAVAASAPSYARPSRARHVMPHTAAAQPYAVSRSLAHGLVSRLMAETAEADRLSIQDAGIIQPATDRAAAFPRICAWLARSSPHHLLIRGAVLSADEQHRRSRKGDRFLALHWTADPVRKCVGARLHVVHERKLEEAQGPLLRVTMRALTQAFYRLNTRESGAVLCELSYAAKAALVWHEALPRVQAGEEILLPTPNGALAVVRDADRSAEFGGLVARTWMSDRWMKDNYRRLTAVRRARLQCSVVINRASFPLLRVATQRDGRDGAEDMNN